ncbi:MFS multidrug transporter [Hyaloscypha variabilis F]|uniref:MFS multidrug transporter n=1 Tax=Hyaloscypha variabilis (strain UAMH 11265 / GT02V1 / F) TaxID=1149755 RepID=A0A2J6QSH0_HYAVF|nr:MFS multidrug transporter [Hyaloscypha variabilis F]
MAGKGVHSDQDSVVESHIRKSSLQGNTKAEKDVDAEAAPPSKLLSEPVNEAPVSNSNIVWWNGDDDPANPRNWSQFRKWSGVGIVSAISFITPLASSMFAPGVPQLMVDFKSTNSELASFVVSVFVLGFAVGPLFVAPLSENYGRLWVFHTCNILFLTFTVACAVSNSLNMLIVFRFLAGCSAPYTIGSGTIADLIVQEKRGVAMSLFSMGPLMGPIIGPVAGGYLAQAKGWRWVFWLISIIDSAVIICSLIFMRETNPIKILANKAKRLRQVSGNPHLRSKLDTGRSPRDILLSALIRPAKMLLFSPIILALSSFVAIIYGYLYILFTTFPFVFEDQYGFSSGTVGLTYLGLGVGCFVGLLVFGSTSDKIIKMKAGSGEMKPEYRLLPMIYGAPCIPIGLFWYGWSAEAHTHWIVPIIGTAFVGIGLIATIMPVQTYIVDAFTVHAASGIAAAAVFRSVFAAVIPLFGRKMYSALGLGWGNSLLGFIALAMCPIPLMFYRYGEVIRKKFVLKL